MNQRCQCSRCQHPGNRQVRRNKKRCASYRYEWRPGMLPLRLTLGEWRRLLRWSVPGPSVEVIAQEARLHRQRVLRALLLVHQTMVRDVPPLFSGLVEVDEIYVTRLQNTSISIETLVDRYLSACRSADMTPRTLRGYRERS